MGSLGRARSRRVHSGSRGFPPAWLSVTGSFWFARVRSSATSGRSSLNGFTRAHLVVFGFICVPVGSLFGVIRVLVSSLRR